MSNAELQKIIDGLKMITDAQQKAHALGTDLIEFTAAHFSVIDRMAMALWGEKAETFMWYCYGQNFGRGMSRKNPKMWDKDKNPLCYDIKSLRRYLEAD